MLPISYPHPTGLANPVTLRAAAALPAAGAWDTTPTEFPIIAADIFTLYLTYTRGAAGGAFDFQIQYSPYYADLAGVEDWFNDSALALGGVVLGADTQHLIQAAYTTFESQGATAEMVIYGPIQLERTIERIRVRARESADGVVGTPGTLHIVGVFNGE